jgi:hypothetical protein
MTMDPTTVDRRATEAGPPGSQTALADRLAADASGHLAAQGMLPSQGQQDTIRSLAEAIERQAGHPAGEGPHLVIVEGLSGTGKSAVVRAMREASKGLPVSCVPEGEHPVHFFSSPLCGGKAVLAAMLPGQAKHYGITADSSPAGLTVITHKGFSSAELLAFLADDHAAFPPDTVAKIEAAGISRQDMAACSLGSRVMLRAVYQRLGIACYQTPKDPAQLLQQRAAEVFAPQFFGMGKLEGDALSHELGRFHGEEIPAGLLRSMSSYRRPTTALFEGLEVLPFRCGGPLATPNRYRELAARDALFFYSESRIIITAYGLAQDKLQECPHLWQERYDRADRDARGRPPDKVCLWLIACPEEVTEAVIGSQFAPPDIEIEWNNARNYMGQRDACSDPGGMLQFESGNHNLTSEALRAAAAMESLLQELGAPYLVCVQSHYPKSILTQYLLYQPEERRFLPVPEPERGGAPLFDSRGRLLTQ